MSESREPFTFSQALSAIIYWCQECRLEIMFETAREPECPNCHGHLIEENRPNEQIHDLLSSFREFDSVDESQSDKQSNQELENRLYRMIEHIYHCLHSVKKTSTSTVSEALKSQQSYNGEDVSDTFSTESAEQSEISELFDRTISLINAVGDTDDTSGTIENSALLEKAFNEMLKQVKINGDIPKGASEEQLRKLTQRKITKEDIAHTEICGVCRDKYNIDEMVTAMPCDIFKHFFHDVCIRKWLLISDTCPFCRKKM